MRNIFLFIAIACCSMLAAQNNTAKWRVTTSHPQKHFRGIVPRGNYSGITRVSDDVYTMVSDKSDSAIFFNVRLYISKQTGELLQAEYLGTKGEAELIGLDNEAIARVTDSTVVVASEGKCRLKEYMLDGKPSNENMWGWSVSAEDVWPNYAFESLTYDSLRNTLWTINEAPFRRDGRPASPQNIVKNVLRLLAFDMSHRDDSPKAYLYRMDIPSTMKTAQTYAMGVSELCALPDGQLLVLEREAFIPKAKMGAFCQCKLYIIDPSKATPYSFDKEIEPGATYIEKRLLTSWRTNISVLSQSWANYEGMCLGPQLENGDQVIVLVSDSQDGYAGILRDWFKTIVISKK